MYSLRLLAADLLVPDTNGGRCGKHYPDHGDCARDPYVNGSRRAVQGTAVEGAPQRLPGSPQAYLVPPEVQGRQPVRPQRGGHVQLDLDFDLGAPRSRAGQSDPR